jgi:hypothetical protein
MAPYSTDISKVSLAEVKAVSNTLRQMRKATAQLMELWFLDLLAVIPQVEALTKPIDLPTIRL